MSVLKWHYLLWFGSLSGIMPLVPIFAKRHSVATAESVGILYFVLPFVVSFVKPVFCSIADRNNCHKKVLIISIILTILGYGLLLTIVFINFGSFSWYWFCILILIANSGQGIVISLTDYLVMKEVTETNKTFGEYRVFGTIGWGGFGLIAGLINEYITQLPYLLPGLLMFILIEFVDLICIFAKFKGFRKNMRVSETEPENNRETNKTRNSMPSKISKSIGAVLETLGQLYKIVYNNPSIIQYIIIVMTFGCLTAFHWSFYFWYIEVIRGRDPLLMGLTLFVQSFIGEIPIFMISHHILRICGPSMSLNISLLAFAFRYYLYGYVLNVGKTYWDVLLIETVQGLTFSLFYTVMTDLAQYYADQENKNTVRIEENGSEEEIDNSEIEVNQMVSIEPPKHRAYATMQGIFGGSFEGLGLGIGSLIGGYVIQRVGVFYIWKYGCFIAIATIIFNIVVELIKKTYTKNVSAIHNN